MILNVYPVRNLEGLQEYFSIKDMLKYFRNGLLLRWLEVRRYKKEYDAVEKIGAEESNKDIYKKLIQIFDMEIEEAYIEKSIKILEYLEEEKELIIYTSLTDLRKKIIVYYQIRIKSSLVAG